MSEVPGSTHSEFTPVKISSKTELPTKDDVEGAAERLEEACSDGEHGIEAGIQVYHADVRALLTDWRQRGEEIERLQKEVKMLRYDNGILWDEVMDISKKIRFHP